MVLFTLQLAMNILSGIFLYKIHQAKKSQESKIQSNWQVQWEEEKRAMVERFSTQLRSMRLLYEKTQKILDEREWDFRKSFPPSLEENELRHLVNQSPLGHCVSLDAFEKEKNEFSAKHSLDLKKLLTEQLC